LIGNQLAALMWSSRTAAGGGCKGRRWHLCACWGVPHRCQGL